MYIKDVEDIVLELIKEYDLDINVESAGYHVWCHSNNEIALEKLKVICTLVCLDVSKTQLSVLTNTPFITIFR